MLELIGAVIAGFAAGVLGTISSGGGLLTIPYLLFIGFPIDRAIATNRLLGLGVIAGSIDNFYKSKKIDWKLAPKLSALAVIGGLIGAKVVAEINQSLLENIVGIVLLFLIPVIFFDKDFGLKTRKTDKLNKRFGFILYFAALIFGGFFGAGAGIFLLYILVQFFGLTMLRALATNMVAWTFLSVSAFTVFAFSGLVDYKIGLFMTAGGIIGGYAGSKIALEKGDGFVKVILTVVILATSAKLLLF